MPRCSIVGTYFRLRIRPDELEFSSEEAGEPLRFLLRRAPHPFRLRGERFDLDDESASLTLVAPEAFYAPIDQEYRREPPVSGTPGSLAPGAARPRGPLARPPRSDRRRAAGAPRPKVPPPLAPGGVRRGSRP